jgi:hypothetical protein
MDDSSKDPIQWEPDGNVVPMIPGTTVAHEPESPIVDDQAERSYDALVLDQSESASAPPVMPEGFTESDFEQEDEPFDRPDAQKLGILGGKGVGKSYLFQSMVYRTFAGQQAGALTYYLERDSMRLFMAEGSGSNGAERLIRTGAARTLNRVTFIDKYLTWQRLAFTSTQSQQWYRLRLSFRTGWLGGSQSAIDVEFFDGSGEGFFELLTLTSEDWALWAKAYLDATVMVFCLPLWAAFPGADLSDEDWKTRERLLAGFEQVVQNYGDLRRRCGRSRPVSSILAFTMADDRRSALRTLYDRWISPYLDAPHPYLRQLRKGGGIARYLNNARRISEAMHEEFAAVGDPRVAGIPQSLDFGRGRPWIVPLSAIDGARLDELETKYPNPDDPARLRDARVVAPTPVHVELPLLVALCERENALM